MQCEEIDNLSEMARHVGVRSDVKKTPREKLLLFTGSILSTVGRKRFLSGRQQIYRFGLFWLTRGPVLSSNQKKNDQGEIYVMGS